MGQMAPSFWARKQWSWMGISLDNGDRISPWAIIDSDKEHAFATMLHPDGRQYEGASKVAGQMEGKPVTGHAVVELVGDWN